MNKLKILVASALCSLFVIGLAGCGDEPVEGSACTQATAENDCASSTATKYVCHKQGNKETCLRECVNDDNCTSAETCVDSSNPGKKVCLPKASEGGNKCGDKTCKADEVCDESGAKPTCKAKGPEKTTYYAIMIVDTSKGEACNQKDAGSDIGGVIIKNASGDTLGYYGTSSSDEGNVHSDYLTANNLPEDPFTPTTDNCPFKGLSKDENKAKVHVLGCGGKAVFQNQSKTVSFQTGDKIQIFEYDGKVCSGLNDSPDDTYTVYACKSKEASVAPNAVAKVEIGKDCIEQAKDVSGYQEITVK